MAEWVDFAEVRARVSLEQVLFEYYALTTLNRTAAKTTGPCPVHQGKSPRAFHADLTRNIWHCFSRCKRGGNQLDFVAAKEGISVREAALLLQRHFLEGAASKPPKASRPSADKPQRRVKERQPDAPSPANDDTDAEVPAAATANKVIEVELRLKREHPHLLKARGLKLSTLRHFGVGYCSRGLMRGCIAIPIHNAGGELIAYAGRRLKPSDIEQFGKYKLPKGFHKDLELYNWHRAKLAVDELGFVIIVEGFFSVLKLYEYGFANVVAPMGCSVSERQASTLASVPEVVVLFDGNEAGRSGAEQVRAQLGDRCDVRIAHPPAHEEPEDLTGRGLRWLVNGIRLLGLSEVALRRNVERDLPGSTSQDQGGDDET